MAERQLTMRCELVESVEAAIAAARAFLRDSPAANGLYTVSAEQDYWIVRIESDGQPPVQVFVDAYDGMTTYYSESVVDVAIVKPAT
jgi:hypothetical protein